MSEQLIKFESSLRCSRHIEARIESNVDDRAVIYGVVIDKKDNPVKDAVIKLILLEDPNDYRSIIPLTHTFTDEYGQFLFGPLPPNKTYLIKIWHEDIYVRKIVVKPNEVKNSCITIRESTALIKTKNKIPIFHSEK